MADVTVSQFAEVLKVPVERLLTQLDEAGIQVSGADDMISDDAKMELLTFLRRAHGRTQGTAAPPQDHAEAQVPGRNQSRLVAGPCAHGQRRGSQQEDVSESQRARRAGSRSARSCVAPPRQAAGRAAAWLRKKRLVQRRAELLPMRWLRTAARGCRSGGSRPRAAKRAAETAAQDCCADAKLSVPLKLRLRKLAKKLLVCNVSRPKRKPVKLAARERQQHRRGSASAWPIRKLVSLPKTKRVAWPKPACVPKSSASTGKRAAKQPPAEPARPQRGGGGGGGGGGDRRPSAARRVARVERCQRSFQEKETAARRRPGRAVVRRRSTSRVSTASSVRPRRSSAMCRSARPSRSASWRSAWP